MIISNEGITYETAFNILICKSKLSLENIAKKFNVSAELVALIISHNYINRPINDNNAISSKNEVN